MDGIKQPGRIQAATSNVTDIRSRSSEKKVGTPAEVAKATSNSVVLNLSSSSTNSSKSTGGSIRSYNEAREVANDVARRLKGDEHGNLGAENVEAALNPKQQ